MRKLDTPCGNAFRKHARGENLQTIFIATNCFLLVNVMKTALVLCVHGSQTTSDIFVMLIRISLLTELIKPVLFSQT